MSLRRALAAALARVWTESQSVQGLQYAAAAIHGAVRAPTAAVAARAIVGGPPPAAAGARAASSQSSSSSSARMSFFDSPPEKDVPPEEVRRRAAEAATAATHGSRIWRQQRREEERAALLAAAGGGAGATSLAPRRQRRHSRRQEQQEEGAEVGELDRRQKGTRAAAMAEEDVRDDATATADNDEDDDPQELAAREALDKLDARLARRAAAHARRYRYAAAKVAGGPAAAAPSLDRRSGTDDGGEASEGHPHLLHPHHHLGRSPRRRHESWWESQRAEELEHMEEVSHDRYQEELEELEEEKHEGAQRRPARARRPSSLLAAKPRPMNEQSRAMLGELDSLALREALRYERARQRDLKRHLAAIDAARGPVLRPDDDEDDDGGDAAAAAAAKLPRRKGKPRVLAPSRPLPPPPPVEDAMAEWAAARRAVLLGLRRARLVELCSRRGLPVMAAGAGNRASAAAAAAVSSGGPAPLRLKTEMVEALLEVEAPGVAALLELQRKEEEQEPPSEEQQQREGG